MKRRVFQPDTSWDLTADAYAISPKGLFAAPISTDSVRSGEA
jgi:hypothetical protein